MLELALPCAGIPNVWFTLCLKLLSLSYGLLIDEDKVKLAHNGVLGTIPLNFIHVWHFSFKPEETSLINDHAKCLLFSSNSFQALLFFFYRVWKHPVLQFDTSLLRIISQALSALYWDDYCTRSYSHTVGVVQEKQCPGNSLSSPENQTMNKMTLGGNCSLKWWKCLESSIAWTKSSVTMDFENVCCYLRFFS